MRKDEVAPDPLDASPSCGSGRSSRRRLRVVQVTERHPPTQETCSPPNPMAMGTWTSCNSGHPKRERNSAPGTFQSGRLKDDGGRLDAIAAGNLNGEALFEDVKAGAAARIGSPRGIGSTIRENSSSTTPGSRWCSNSTPRAASRWSPTHTRGEEPSHFKDRRTLCSDIRSFSQAWRSDSAWLSQRGPQPSP